MSMADKMLGMPIKLGEEFMYWGLCLSSKPFIFLISIKRKGKYGNDAADKDIFLNNKHLGPDLI